MSFASCHTNIQNTRKKIHVSLLFSGVQSRFSYMWMLKQFYVTVLLCPCVTHQQSWLCLISYTNGTPVSLDFQNLIYCVKSFVRSRDPVLIGKQEVMLLFLKQRLPGVDLSPAANYQGCRARVPHEGASSSGSKFLRMSFYFICTRSPILLFFRKIQQGLSRDMTLFERKESFFNEGRHS